MRAWRLGGLVVQIGIEGAVRPGWGVVSALVVGLLAALPAAAGTQDRQSPRGQDEAGIDARMLADLEILRDLELLRQLDLLRKMDEVQSERSSRGGKTDERGKP